MHHDRALAALNGGEMLRAGEMNLMAGKFESASAACRVESSYEVKRAQNGRREFGLSAGSTLLFCQVRTSFAQCSVPIMASASKHRRDEVLHRNSQSQFSIEFQTEKTASVAVPRRKRGAAQAACGGGGQSRRRT